jgi:Mg-chelatase subunit ChlD
MKTNPIYNLIILDESGSMESIRQSTISGFNEIVQTTKEMQKQFPDEQHYISLVTFNGTGIRTVHDRQPVHQLEEIDNRVYRPNSSTPLHDAIGLSITRLKFDIADQKDARVLVTILTDGEENSSREYHASHIKAMIDELKLAGWTFTYIGSNHDVEKVAYSLSISNTMSFKSNPEDVKAMFETERSARCEYNQKRRDGKEVGEDYFKKPDQTGRNS